MENFKSIEDIQSLIENKIKESLSIEYKKELPKNNSDIAKIVSGFANTKGGIIIYGIEEDRNGLPISVNWLNVKGVKERIESIILHHITPKVKGIKINQIEKENDNSKAVFIVKVPESLESPHMSNHKYYIRRSFKTEPMEQYEVKKAMLNKGLLLGLKFELKKNTEHIGKILNKMPDIWLYSPEKRGHIMFTPYYDDVWKTITNSGMIFLLENSEKFIEIYSKIRELNHYIDAQKHGLSMVVTQDETIPVKGGIYLAALIRDKSQELFQLFSKPEIKEFLGE